MGIFAGLVDLSCTLVNGAELVTDRNVLFVMLFHYHGNLSTPIT
ncbi:MAG: hypothetical protein JWM11_1970 [Planctomycetaceae bacterium]|nr:hypothetical protein [Planctomycetaceae bacterium]